MKIITSILVSLFLALSAFATENSHVRNGVNGAALGAGIGAIIGNNSGKGDGRKGAAIGAVLGAVLAVNNTRSPDSRNPGYSHSGFSSMGQLERDITDASRQYAAEQAEADRLQAFADAAQRRASEVRSRLYDLQNARDSLLRAGR